MSRQRRQALHDWYEFAEPLRRVQQVQSCLVVLLLKRSGCVGSIQPGVQPIAFGVGDWSIRLAPVGRRNRQVTAHPVQATRRTYCPRSAEETTVRHGDGDQQRDLSNRGALSSRSCNQGRGAGLVPEGRRPSSATAWLLLILFLPVVGLVAFWLIGSPFVDRGRRRRQAAVGQVISGALNSTTDDLLPVPAGSTLNTLVVLNRRLGWLPSVGGNKADLLSDYDEAIAAMAREVRTAERYCMWSSTS
jgi:Phospholipase_D-nuclease N-terminal